MKYKPNAILTIIPIIPKNESTLSSDDALCLKNTEASAVRKKETIVRLELILKLCSNFSFSLTSESLFSIANCKVVLLSILIITVIIG